MNLRAKVNGIANVKRRLEAERRALAKGVEIGLGAAARLLLGFSRDAVPVDTGALRDSGYTRKKGQGLNTRAFVGYGEDYALQVHEDMQAAHDDGGPKYLERPARERRRELLQAAAKKAKR